MNLCNKWVKLHWKMKCPGDIRTLLYCSMLTLHVNVASSFSDGTISRNSDNCCWTDGRADGRARLLECGMKFDTAARPKRTTRCWSCPLASWPDCKNGKGLKGNASTWSAALKESVNHSETLSYVIYNLPIYHNWWKIVLKFKCTFAIEKYCHLAENHIT